MKTRTFALILAPLFAALILGAALLQSSAQTSLPINVVFDPKSFTWDGPVDPWNAELWRQKVADRADTSSILLEGLYRPGYFIDPLTYPAPYNATHGPRLIVPFRGVDVMAAIGSHLPTHEGVLIPGTYKVTLIITGTMRDTGETFEGDGSILVTIPPPPP